MCMYITALEAEGVILSLMVIMVILTGRQTWNSTQPQTRGLGKANAPSFATNLVSAAIYHGQSFDGFHNEE
jgi:hypothetical protein